MSDEKKTNGQSQGQREPLRASLIYWKKPKEIPGPASMKGHVQARNTTTGDEEYRLEFFPWIRHWRITFTPRDHERKPEVGMVHETDASIWFPLDETVEAEAVKKEAARRPPKASQPRES